MILFVWLLTTHSFFHEVRKARAVLEERLEVRRAAPDELGFQ